MSTKIYYGFQVATKKASDIIELVKKYRKEHWDNDARYQKNVFISSIVNSVEDPDKKVMDKSVGYERSAYSKAEDLWHKMRGEIKKTGERNPLVDTDFQIVVFPYKNKFLGISYTDHYKWFKKFLKYPGVSEYGYWNNTDQPEHITWKQWEKRGKIWDEVLGDLGIPSMVGFTIDIHDPFGPGFIPKDELFTKAQLEEIFKNQKQDFDEEEG